MLANGDQSARPTTTDLRFADLQRRMDSQDRVLEKLDNGSATIVASQFRIEKALIEATEQLKARSEANTTAIKNLDDKVEHKDQSSIARDQQQMVFIRAEETAREAAMAERRRAHDADIAGLRADIKEINAKVSDSVMLTRILLFVVAAFAVAVIGAAVTGHLGIVVHP